jgi:hypothetical protein
VPNRLVNRSSRSGARIDLTSERDTRPLKRQVDTIKIGAYDRRKHFDDSISGSGRPFLSLRSKPTAELRVSEYGKWSRR